MIIYPAIDLMGGKCVRLLYGEFDQVTTFDADPIEAAQRWHDQGAEWLHIIDLDGARAGQPIHLPLIQQIASTIGLPIRLGGGLRTAADVAAAFAAGVTTVTLGTAALDTALLNQLVEQWGSKIEVALDRRGDKVAVSGWQQDAPGTVSQWAKVATNAGVRSFLVTDINRDGAMSGANVSLVAQTKADAGDDTIAVTIAGGVSTLTDIAALYQAGAAGAVIGRALYTGQIDLSSAIATARGETSYAR